MVLSALAGVALYGRIAPTMQALLAILLLILGLVLLFPLLATSYGSLVTRGAVQRAGRSHAVVGLSLIAAATGFALGLTIAATARS